VPEVVVTLYSSSFCGACASTRRTLEQVVPLLGDRVTWREVNVAADPDEAEAHAVLATPTVVFASPTGEELRRASGVPTAHQVLAAIAQSLPAD
jgi:thiol-disulfide isomerase/thioredoxin